MENKTILTYLSSLSSKLRLPDEERQKIETSVKAIKDKLVVCFFDDGLKEVKPFGSFDRETLLSRKVDSESDVDILIVFDEKKWEPQTYLNKLKQFANDNYSRSDNYQDHPTIAIELTAIKFELTPCIFKEETFWDNEKYLIPKKQSGDIQWIRTEPDQLKDKISEFKKTKETLLDLIHLFKYWNITNGKLYSTFKLEKFVIDYFDYEENLDYNFFRIIDKLNYLDNEGTQTDLNKSTQAHKNKIEVLLDNEMEEYAMMELKKIVPELE